MTEDETDDAEHHHEERRRRHERVEGDRRAEEARPAGGEDVQRLLEEATGVERTWTHAGTARTAGKVAK